MIGKNELVQAVYQRNDISKSVVEKIVQDFVEELVRAIVEGKSVRIYELGTFRPSVRKAYTGKHPTTGESIEIPETKLPHLKFSAAVRDAMNE